MGVSQLEPPRSMECCWTGSRAQCWEDVKEGLQRVVRGLSLFRKFCKLQDKLELGLCQQVVAASSAQAFRCKLDSCVSGMA